MEESWQAEVSLAGDLGEVAVGVVMVAEAGAHAQLAESHRTQI